MGTALREIVNGHAGTFIKHVCLCKLPAAISDKVTESTHNKEVLTLPLEGYTNGEVTKPWQTL